METIQQLVDSLEVMNREHEQRKINVHESLKKSGLLKLPKTFILFNICQYLECDDINNLAATSSILYQLIFSPSHQVAYKITVNQQFNIKSNQIIEQVMENQQNINITNNNTQTEEDTLAYIDTLKKKQEFFQERFREDQKKIDSFQNQTNNLQDKLTTQREINAQDFIRMQKLEQKIDKMSLENKDHKENFKELNTKYQSIIKTYLGEIEEKKDTNAELNKKSKVLANEVKKQRVEIDKLNKQNVSYKESLNTLKQVFDKSSIIEKIQSLAQKIN